MVVLCPVWSSLTPPLVQILIHITHTSQRGRPQPRRISHRPHSNVVEIDASRRLLWVHRWSSNGHARVDDWVLEDLWCAYALTPQDPTT